MFCTRSKINACKVPNVGKNGLGEIINLVSWLNFIRDCNIIPTLSQKRKNDFLMLGDVAIKIYG